MNILIVEDDATTARALSMLLQQEGFQTYTADLGEEGVDLGKIYDYDLILLDLNLPEIILQFD